MYHGLSYPHPLDDLPVLPTTNNNPIRALSASQFGSLHLQHALAHPPDHVLFPFLHGLEGDNHAQNTFFASSAFPNPNCTSSSTSSRRYPDLGAEGHNKRIPPNVPAYRGLVWVVCEEDLATAADSVSLAVLRRRPVAQAHSPQHEDAAGEQPVPSSSSDEDEDEMDDDEDLDLDMDMDGMEGQENAHAHVGVGLKGSKDAVMSYAEDLDEDEQAMRMMAQREAAVAASVHAVPPSPSITTPSKANPNPDATNSPAASLSPTPPPSSFTDANAQDDAYPPSSPSSSSSSPPSPPSPFLRTPLLAQDPAGGGMQVDAVRILSPADGEESLLAGIPAIGADGMAADMDLALLKEKEKEKEGLQHYEGAHMHPVAHRPTLNTAPAPLSVQTLAAAGMTLAAEMTPTPTPSDSESTSSLAIPSTTTTTTTNAAMPADPPTPDTITSNTTNTTPKPRLTRPTDPAAPPLLTSTFRPKELIRRTRMRSRSSTAGSTASLNGASSSANAKGQSQAGQARVGGGNVGQGYNGGQRVAGDGEEEDDGWEFVPARVPEGISLRNFGIQVPIYATLSDIVVYSPHGATPATIALARRFQAAIRAKRNERLRMRAAAAAFAKRTNAKPTVSVVFGADSNTNTNTNSAKFNSMMQQAGDEEDKIALAATGADSLLEYNVFVLDATEDELRKAVPHLMMRVYGAGVPGGATQTTCADGGDARAGCANRSRNGAHTDDTNGHLMEQTEKEEKETSKKEKQGTGGVDVDMDMVADMDMGEEVAPETFAMDVDRRSPALGGSKAASKETVEDKEELHCIPNTVDFAFREREEMRDLTKASEIITLYPALTSTTLPSSASTTSASSTSANLHSSAPKAAHNTIETQSDSPPSWDPRTGQVFLGNSNDVPLAPDVPTQFRHAASIPRDADEAARWDWRTLTRHLRSVDGLLAEYDADTDNAIDGPQTTEECHREREAEARLQPNEDDPFNYAATNDPALGFGYDVCIECHDLAPFPSTAHLRAAEEHLALMDVMWREKWEKAWYAREERRSRMASALDSGSESSAEGQDQDGKENEARRRRSSAPTPPPLTPPRPPPHANAVIHLPFPSSPQNSQATMVALMPIVRFLEKWVRPAPQPVPKPPALETPSSSSPDQAASASASSRRWSSVTSLMPSFPSFPGVGANSATKPQSAAPTPPPSGALPPHPSRSRAMTSPSSQQNGAHPLTAVQARTRPLKVLLYSSDGYTESSVPALCLLMAIKGLMLPEAYLELQVEKRRSFFVYQSDLGVLRRVEARLREEREREKEKEREREREREKMAAGAYMASIGGAINANGKRTAPPPAPTRGGYWTGAGTPAPTSSPHSASSGRHGSFMGRPAAKSVSFAQAPPQVMTTSYYQQQQNQQPQHQVSVPPKTIPSGNGIVSATPPVTQSAFGFGSLPKQNTPYPAAFSTSGTIHHSADANGGHIPQQSQIQQANGMAVVKGRPRASTSPWLPSLFGGDHQSWFNDPRFDGSFPSRVLPFLYLGNLNHASNVYMLHALGITHVVSVGECALVPPPHHMSLHGGTPSGSFYRPGPGSHFVPGKGSGGQGCLWIEEREGRIKVLDIKGVCDDGIDTLEPQLEPICEWIDKARQEGGQVLVHCRVGVSRSATVTIAYVMKHLGLPLVDAYLIVRSRRLSVLIQPNMRLLYNLCGWEIKLAKERARDDEHKLKKELARTLTWPYLAKEVHALNEKYLH